MSSNVNGVLIVQLRSVYHRLSFSEQTVQKSLDRSAQRLSYELCGRELDADLPNIQNALFQITTVYHRISHFQFLMQSYLTESSFRLSKGPI